MTGAAYNQQLLRDMVLRDACGLADHLNQVDPAWELNMLLPEIEGWDPPLREVQLRLWDPATDLLVAAAIYTFPDPRGVHLLPGPDLSADPGEPLEPPKRRDLILQIALFRFDDDADRLLTPGDPRHRRVRAALDAASGAVLLPAAAGRKVAP